MNQNDPACEQRSKTAKGAISYICNELLENAVKFNLDSDKYKVKLGAHFPNSSDLIAVVFATNNVDFQEANRFQELIQELLACDLEERYAQQVEASAEDDAEVSGLGLLTMINDYQAKLGWKFEPTHSGAEILAVTTMAQITV